MHLYSWSMFISFILQFFANCNCFSSYTDKSRFYKLASIRGGGTYFTRKHTLMMRCKKNSKNDVYDKSEINAGSIKGLPEAFDGRGMSPVYKPRTENQKKYCDYLGEPDTKIVLAVGSAGSGKTLFACYTAIQCLKKGVYKKIIITRPVVPVEEEEIGFLPGSLNSKMDPWTRPIFDVFLEFYSQRDIDIMLHSGIIEISPLAFMRGRTFKKTFIIADEMQNSSPNQMLMLTTRLGWDSKMVITGDLKQSDRGENNGLKDILDKWKRYIELNDSSQQLQVNKTYSENQEIKYVELGNNDILRSSIVSLVLNVYANKNVTAKKTVQKRSKPLLPIQVVSKNETYDIPSNRTYIMQNISDSFREPKVNLTVEICKNISSSNVQYSLLSNRYSVNNDDDAALIPLSHMSRNFIRNVSKK